MPWIVTAVPPALPPDAGEIENGSRCEKGELWVQGTNPPSVLPWSGKWTNVVARTVTRSSVSVTGRTTLKGRGTPPVGAEAAPR